VTARLSLPPTPPTPLTPLTPRSAASVGRRPFGLPERGNPRVVLAVILVAQLMVMLDMSIVNVALPQIQRGLGFTPSGLSWVLNAYTLAFGGLLLLGARAGDLLGRRRSFVGGVLLFTVASLLGGLAASPGLLVAARTAQGIGGALIAPATLALLTSMFPEGRERTRALGLYTAVSIGGASVGLVAGGMLTQWLSWRWVMFVNVPIGIALVVATALFVQETARQRGRFDLAGALTSTVGMTSLVYGFVHAASHGWRSPETIGAFVVGLALMAVFVAVERRAPAPITPLVLFADVQRSSAYVARMLLIAAMTGMFFFLTLFLQDVLGFSALATGFAFLPITLALFTASQLSARVLVERYGGRRVMTAGIALSLSGLLWLTGLSTGSGYPTVLVTLVLVGLGNGTAFVPLTSAALQGVRPEHAGAASGLVNVMQQMGASLGLAVLVTVFGTASRAAVADVPAGTSHADAVGQLFVAGADAAFQVAAALLAVTLVIVAAMGRRPRVAG
jgi:EmrB/QacA subfamily drug resistance transporter